MSVRSMRNRWVIVAGAAVAALAHPAAAQEGDVVDYMNAVSIREQTTSGRYVSDVPLRRQSAIIDDDSRLIVRFNREELARLVNFPAVRARYDSLRNDNVYKQRLAEHGSLADSLRAAAGDTVERNRLRARRTMLDRWLTASRNLVLSRGAGYRFIITARVEPKEGQPYDVEVQGFTSIATRSATEVQKSDTDTSAAEKVTSVQTRVTSSDVRVFAPEYQLLRGDLVLTLADDLPDGIIELRPLDLKEGDRVVVSIENQFHGRRRLAWALSVRDIGVHTDQSATLLLVDRRGTLPEDDTTQRTSQFEPAPGASFLFKVTTRSPGWNFLSPAIGLNGSFVDFRSDKSVEIGIGPVISLFDGILQASYGWNISTSKPNRYWSIGLGFLDLASKFGGGDSKQGNTATGAAGTQAAAPPPPPPPAQP